MYSVDLLAKITALFNRCGSVQFIIPLLKTVFLFCVTGEKRIKKESPINRNFDRAFVYTQTNLLYLLLVAI